MTSMLDDLLPRHDTPLAVSWPVGLPDHLSPSSIGMYMRCREAYRQRYVLGRKERPGAALVWGSANGYAHETNFRQKISSHIDISVDDVQVAFAEGFDQAVSRNGGESEILWDDDKPGALKDAGAALVAAYHRQVSPRVQPVAVEADFRVEVAGVPVPVVGRTDVETAGPVIEMKTAKRAEKSVPAKWRVQGRVYQLARQRNVDFHVSTKTRTPAVWTPVEAPDLTLVMSAPLIRSTELLLVSVARDMVATWAAFGPDQPWPGDGLADSWACDWCGYRPTCAYWGAA